jgi:DNA sulfur modification protein DndB
MHGRDTYLLVPQSEWLLAIDGETQLSGHFEVPSNFATTPEEKEAHRQFPLGMVVHHGIDTEAARQYFHDLNILAVKPNTSLGLSMDTKDPIMKVVSDLEIRIPMLNGKVDKQARQLSKKSMKIMTVQSLRQFTIDVMLGMAGIQYGSKPAPIPEDVRLDDLEEVSRAWLDKYLAEFAADVIDRENTLAGSAPVLAAVGAIGNTILKAETWDRERIMREALEQLKQVNWTKGDHWAGIAGKFTARGTFSVGGTKEVAYAVFHVLTDSTNAGHSRVRQAPPVAAVA